jgi:hypothetical protein
MTKQELFEIIDDIQKMWDAVEAKVNLIPFKEDGFPLSIERVGGNKRLCYEGKPLGECALEARIDAVSYLPDLIKKINERDRKIEGKVSFALHMLNLTLKELGDK